MDQNNRYDRQIRLPYIDHAGQEKLGRAHVAIVGQGALGTSASSYLARAGVGHILIIDNDIVELSNLQRQTLFDESDVGRSKADAACEHLGKINSDISIASSRERLTEDNAPALLGGADIVIDASDNFEARKIINNCCVPRGIPWIYGGVVQSQGMTMNIVPGGPCFACLMPGETPERGTYPIAGTHGILSTAAPFIAAVQATEAIKIITHGFASSSVRKTLLYVDLWDNVFQEHSIVKLPGCPVCGGKDQHGSR